MTKEEPEGMGFAEHIADELSDEHREEEGPQRVDRLEVVVGVRDVDVDGDERHQQEGELDVEVVHHVDAQDLSKGRGLHGTPHSSAL